VARVDRRILLGLIVLLAVAVRLAGIGDTLSNDEGYSWLVSSADGWHDFLRRMADFENTPPLLYLLLRPLPLDDEVWLRLPPLVAGVACVAVLYAIVRPVLGTRVALLSALGLAVAPYAVSFSNYSRGFMQADLGVLLALWAAARLAQGWGRRWWWLYGAGASLALWSEYSAGFALAAVVGALLVLGVPRRREVLTFAWMPLLTLVPWAWQMKESVDQIDVTKVAPTYPNPGFGSLRDLLVPLMAGEHGAADGTGQRSVQFLLVVGALGAAVWLIRRHRGRESWGPRRTVLWLVGGVFAGTLVIHAFVHEIGPDVFAQRYLTILIPLAVVLLAAGIEEVGWRWAMPAAAVGAVLIGVGVFAQREGRELEPNPAAVRAAVGSAGGVLTNTPVLAYYLRDRLVLLDRPFGIDREATPTVAAGPKELRDVRRRFPDAGGFFTVGSPAVAVDDTRVAGGARPGLRDVRHVGPITIGRVAS
jgi:4-amino-4-deoxy-L-arabinose transferase-like glycosyltransferase